MNTLRDSLLKFGADLLSISGTDELREPTLAINIECFVALNRYGPYAMKLTSAEHMRCRDAMDGCELSLLKFYIERLSCSCLDQMYAK